MKFHTKFFSAIHLSLLILICISGIFESVFGILQLIGVCSRSNSAFPMTGHFGNPGPFGGFISIGVAAAIPLYFKTREYQCNCVRQILIVISLATIVCGILILPATRSRAAWLALGVSLIIYLYKEKNLSQWVNNHRIVSTVIIVALVLLMLGAFFIKKDSAVGRFHIWHMELRAIAQEPLHGYGKGSVLGVYGQTQAEYFMQKDRSEIIKRVAGCPEYAFNEYLKVAVEHGVPTLLLIVIILVILVFVLLKHRSPIAYSVIALSVFAFFSYPLEALHIKTADERKWENVKMLCSVDLYEDAVGELALLYEGLSDNYRYLYDYGYALYKCGMYEESIDVLKKGAAISSDPMFHNIIGKNFELLGLYDEAEAEYRFAHFMVPQRLYPLVLNMRMCISTGNSEKALQYALMIVNQPINPRHPIMVDLQNEAIRYVESASEKVDL